MIRTLNGSFTVEPGHWENLVSLYWCRARAVKWARNWKILKVLDPPSEPQNYQRDCQSRKIGNGWPRQTLRKSHHPIATSNQRLRGKDWTLRVTCPIKARTSISAKTALPLQQKGQSIHRENLPQRASLGWCKDCIGKALHLHKETWHFQKLQHYLTEQCLSFNEAKPGWRKAPPLHYRDKSLRQTSHSTAFQPPTDAEPSALLREHPSQVPAYSLRLARSSLPGNVTETTRHFSHKDRAFTRRTSGPPR